MSRVRGGRGRVLVLDDEPYVRESLVEMLRARRFEPTPAGSTDEALASLARAPFDALLCDLRLPGTDGLTLIARLRASAPELPVVVLTGHGTVASAVECLKAGASDYLLKPVEPEALELALERALSARALLREVRYLRGATAAPAPAGNSASWQRTLAMVDAAAATDASVLLLGESGTGKELLARRLHAASARAGAAFVRVNCAAVPLELWESEFFGHRKGTFSGALSDREGRFQLAHRGTLLLDEIGTTPLGAQPKLLRVLQDGEFERLGDEQATVVDVRIVAATNADLGAEVKAGRFRADLFYRLDVVRIQVPALRERPEDVPALAQRFAADIASRLGRPTPVFDAPTLARLQAYSWPGNVRELRNVIERALILDPADGLRQLDPLPAGLPEPATQGEPARDLDLRQGLNARERELLTEALRRSAGRRKEAARLLGVDPRNLSYYLRKHGLEGASGEP